MPDLTKRVNKEIARFVRVTHRPWYAYFNNFIANLPGGYRRNIPPRILATRFTQENMSERLRSMTCQEYYNDIDAAIAELEIDVRGIQEKEQTGLAENIDEVYRLLVPLYIRLREKGYNHYPDLTG